MVRVFKLPFSGEENIELDLKEYPSFKDYKKRFEKVYGHLIDGDCYQVNLTSQFYFRYKENYRSKDFISV